MKLIVLTTVVVAAGCVPGGLPDGADGGTTPTSGIYQLSETSTGDCVPALADDHIEAFVIAEKPGDLRIYMSSPWFAPPGLGETFIALDVIDGTFTQNLDMCGTPFRTTFTVEEAASDHLRVRRVDSFSDVAASICPAGWLPTNDCTLTTELDYQLTQPCPPPCTVQTVTPDAATFASSPTFACSC